MSSTQLIITASLVNLCLFYVVTIVLFSEANTKTALNWSLALQYASWLAIEVLSALPDYSGWYPRINDTGRAAVWLVVSFLSWVVLINVYRANWRYGWRAFVKTVAREIVRLPITIVRFLLSLPVRLCRYPGTLYGKWRH